MKHKHRVGRILFVIAFSAALLAGACLAAYQSYGIYAGARHADTERNALLAHALSRSVSIFLSSSERTVETLAAEASVAGGIDREHLQPLVQRFAEQNSGAFLSMYVIGRDGIEVADYKPSGIDDADRLAGIGVDLRDRAYAAAAFLEGRTVVSEAVIGRSTKRPVVVVAAPIYDEFGAVVGLAAGSLDLTVLGDVAKRTASNDGATPVVVDSLGHVVVHRDALLVDSLHDMRGAAPAYAGLAGRSGTTAYIENDGTKMVAAYVPVQEYGWTAWVAEAPPDISNLYSQMAWAAGLSFVGILILSLAAYHLGRRVIFKPLEQLAQEAESAVASDFTRPSAFSVQTPAHEINTLSRTLDVMQRRLQDSRRSESQYWAMCGRVGRALADELEAAMVRWRQAEAGKDAAVRASAAVAIGRAGALIRLTVDELTAAQDIEKHASRRPVAMRTVDIDVLLHEIAANLSDLAKAQDAHVRLDLSEGVSTQGDPEKLRIALSAVIANALLFGKRDGLVDVTVRRDQGELIIRVEDEGPGMSNEEMRSASQEFYRGEEGKKRFPAGFGLGLFVALRYIEAHEGTLTIGTRRDVSGLSVVIRLP